jgi:Family of unknown function (DUF5686)/CarboxypepD_reg-like domain
LGNSPRIFFLLPLFFVFIGSRAQSLYTISGKIFRSSDQQPLQDATVHLVGSRLNTLSKTNGYFKIVSDEWHDSLEISNVGYQVIKIKLIKGQTKGLVVSLKNKTDILQSVIVVVSKKPGRSFMEKVIDKKNKNNPERFRSFNYRRYTRNELDIDKIDYQNTKGSGIKSLMLKTYEGLDSTAILDKELPIYFKEWLANDYHSVSPNIDRENIIAKKSLGLRTDEFISRLDKFYFNFNIYADWIPVFDQMYVSPLNTNAFQYYQFFQGDTTMISGDTILQIRFVPLRKYERAFSGFLWINTGTLAVQSLEMHMNQTAHINFIKDISYSEDYSEVYDSTSDSYVYMPHKFSSSVKFVSGIAMLGLPDPGNKTRLQFVIRNTTVTDRIKINTGGPSEVVAHLVNEEKTNHWNKPESFWEKNRSDSLTDHEKAIYEMVDSLKENRRFQRDVRLIAFAGTGYWDFGKWLRIGPYSSFLSENSLEGWRMRLGFWTMPGISSKINFYGYGVYGTRDHQVRGMLGLKYVWNEAKWTKTTVNYGSDYDFIIENDDELDNDNIISSFLRKNIPYTRMLIKEAALTHEQYISQDFSAKASISYKELNPVFNFEYRPINPALDKPYDSVFAKVLPVAEAGFQLRYAHQERTKILNYDKIPLGSFYPIITASYAYGFEFRNALFDYHRIDVDVEQRLRLPPKSMLFYKIDAGKVFGTLPYLLLDIPRGNEYYVASKYVFNMMSPYEFAADRYVSLHTRFYLGGALFDKIPLLRKWGWRERFSFNSYWGDMSSANRQYNKNSNFNLMGSEPYMEAGVGIENIFHVLSIEYFRRLDYLQNPYAKKNGLFLGVYLVF